MKGVKIRDMQELGIFNILFNASFLFCIKSHNTNLTIFYFGSFFNINVFTFMTSTYLVEHVFFLPPYTEVQYTPFFCLIFFVVVVYFSSFVTGYIFSFAHFSCTTTIYLFYILFHILKC